MEDVVRHQGQGAHQRGLPVVLGAENPQGAEALVADAGLELSQQQVLQGGAGKIAFVIHDDIGDIQNI